MRLNVMVRQANITKWNPCHEGDVLNEKRVTRWATRFLVQFDLTDRQIVFNWLRQVSELAAVRELRFWRLRAKAGSLPVVGVCDARHGRQQVRDRARFQ